MSDSHDIELLEKIVARMTDTNSEQVLLLLRELLDQEQQVAHIARPHRILLNIEEMLKKHLEGK
jgi:hypothetical protein